MKKFKPAYLVIICLCFGLLIEYICVSSHYKSKITALKHQDTLQQLVNKNFTKIHDNIILFENDIYNQPYLRDLIKQDLVELNRALPEKNTSNYTDAVSYIIHDYVKFMTLKDDNNRIKKLLEFYENDLVPCTQININYSFLLDRNRFLKPLTYNDLKDYKIPLNKLYKDVDYHLSSPIYNDNQFVIINDKPNRHLYGYIVSKNLEEPIKVYDSELKGRSCYKVYSQLYDNGALKVTEYNCEQSETVTKHYFLK